MEFPSRPQIRVILTDEELQVPAVDDLCNKYFDWLKISKESVKARKTRATNRRADTIYDEIMAFKLPPIRIEEAPMSPPRPIKTNGHANNNNNNHNTSSKASSDGESESSSVASSGLTVGGRTLRPRCRTPSVSRKPDTGPSTPSHQSIRAHMKKNLDSTSSDVLSAALNQGNQSTSLTKIRQLLRADSAQKKREEERERQEKARLERKAKEEKAEAQKRKLLEERAQTAKLNREQRLLHAAEVRKAREKAKIERKLKEAIPSTSKYLDPLQGESQPTTSIGHTPKQAHTTKQAKQAKPASTLPAQPQPEKTVNQPEKHPEQQPKQQVKHKLDETFQKPANQNDNIDISILDETSDEPNKRVAKVADWAKAPHFRDIIVAQFSKQESELIVLALKIFGGVKLPVDLDQIFASHNPLNKRYLARTSSAVWTPPHRQLKRQSSQVFTPSDTKR